MSQLCSAQFLLSGLSSAIESLKEWQTLVGAVLALAAAWWTVKAVERQIRQEKEHYKDALKRKEFAARAQLPDALSELCRFTEGCMKFHDGRETVQPIRPTDAIAVIKAGLEFIGTQPSEKAFELVSFYQVHNSRFFSRRRRRGLVGADRVYDTALLRYCTSTLEMSPTQLKTRRLRRT